VTGEQFASTLLAEPYFVGTGVDKLTTYGDIVSHLGGEQRASFKIREGARMDQRRKPKSTDCTAATHSRRHKLYPVSAATCRRRIVEDSTFRARFILDVIG
jgi:hypothetical protein